MEKPTTKIDISYLQNSINIRTEIKDDPSNQNSVIQLRERLDKLEKILGLK